MKITITTRMVGVPIFDNTREYELESQLFLVVEQIKKGHNGTVDNIQLWKSKVEPGTILRDTQQSLADIFINERSSDGSVPPQYIYYDYTPTERSCALLNVK